MASGDDEDEAFKARNANREAFAARFPPEAFVPIVGALNVAATVENVSAIRGWLMDCLEGSFSGRPVKARSVVERRKELMRLHDALALVSRVIGTSFRWTLGEITGGEDEKFVAMLQRLRRRVEEDLHKLEATPARRGPKPKTTFRDFAPDLVWAYERLTGEVAKKPYWLPDSGQYGGPFYLFAVTVWECVRECLPQWKDALPVSEIALAEELREHWPKDGANTG
jgi:hypothetical protein